MILRSYDIKVIIKYYEGSYSGEALLWRQVGAIIKMNNLKRLLRSQ